MSERDDHSNKQPPPQRDWLLDAIPVIGLMIFMSFFWVAIVILASSKQ